MIFKWNLVIMIAKVNIIDRSYGFHNFIFIPICILTFYSIIGHFDAFEM